jgi:tellurite resistance protein
MMRSSGGAATPPDRGRGRLPLNTLAIPIGLAGLAEVWLEACRVLGWPALIPDVFWAVAAAAWLFVLAAHALRGRTSRDSLATQLAHPAQGPIAALVPIVGMLISSVLYGFWPTGGLVLAIASISAVALFAGWIVSFWMRGKLELGSVHGGYILPTVAASFIASSTASAVGMRSVANACFIVGCFLWPIVTALVLARLAFRPPLPEALVPTIAILLAPPAAAGAAWFGINGAQPDLIAEGLAAITILMALIQVGLLPIYRKLPFTLGFWSFTFPTAYAAAYALAWLKLSGSITIPVAIVTVVLLAVVTMLIVAIAYRSVVQGSRMVAARNPRQRNNSATRTTSRSLSRLIRRGGTLLRNTFAQITESIRGTIRHEKEENDDGTD